MRTHDGTYKENLITLQLMCVHRSVSKLMLTSINTDMAGDGIKNQSRLRFEHQCWR